MFFLATGFVLSLLIEFSPKNDLYDRSVACLTRPQRCNRCWAECASGSLVRIHILGTVDIDTYSRIRSLLFTFIYTEDEHAIPMAFTVRLADLGLWCCDPGFWTVIFCCTLEPIGCKALLCIITEVLHDRQRLASTQVMNLDPVDWPSPRP